MRLISQTILATALLSFSLFAGHHHTYARCGSCAAIQLAGFGDRLRPGGISGMRIHARRRVVAQVPALVM
jgi:hypothetical protein